MFAFITSMIFEHERFEDVFRMCDWDTVQYVMAFDLRNPWGDGGLISRFYNSAKMYAGGEGAVLSFAWKYAGGLVQFKGSEHAFDYIVFRKDGGITVRGFVVKQNYDQVNKYLPQGADHE
jgi:hypothetical protein